METRAILRSRMVAAALVLTVLLWGGLSSDAKAGCWFPVEPIYSVDEFDDVRCKDMSSIDLSDRPNLPATLWYNQETIWPAQGQMPPGCDPNVIMINAMNPGLGIRALHEQGFTGAGVSVAIIDHDLFQDHPEFAGKVVAYHDLGEHDTSMHGPAVASLLVGSNCGTAPDAQLYYVSCSQTYDTNDYAEGLDWIVEQNETLPASEKIRVVSISAAPGNSPWTYREQYLQARDRAEAAGILVLDVTRFASVCWYDANDPENVAKCTPGFPGMEPFYTEDILVPSSPRTTAEEVYEGDFSYQYTGRGGISWSMPYCAGVLAMGWQIHPELTKEQMVDLLFQTAYVNQDGAKIINPPAFISFLSSDKPVIGIDTTEINFYAVTGEGNPVQQTLSISNIGFGTLNWVLDYDCNWLQVDPNAGSSTGGADINHVTLDVDITDLTPGIHNCELTISDPCATNNSQIVSITLYVSDANAQTIQDAIDAAEEGDTVIIDPGVYMGDGNRDLDFKGKAITVRSTDPNNPGIVASTIILCQGSESDNHCGFSFHNNEDSNSVLSGLTITGAYGSFGGAIKCQNSSPSIINCNFVNNFVSGGGGGIHNSYGSPTLINCIFRNNSSDWIAGALRNHTSSPVVINCLFTGNSANYGGAMQNENTSSNPTLINCTFTGNTASGWAGGILNAGGTPAASPVLTNCIFWGNSDGGGTDESAQIHGGSPIINYSCVQGLTGGFGGVGNIGSNPRFADSNNDDYHLKSEAGRWKPSICIGLDPTGDGFIDMSDFAAFANYWQQVGESGPADLDNNGVVDLSDLALLLNNYLASYPPGNWILDDVTSPCIDAGDPMSPIGVEPLPNGGIINMGAYGGTAEASKSYFGEPVCETIVAGDINGDCEVDLLDFRLMALHWLWQPGPNDYYNDDD